MNQKNISPDPKQPVDRFPTGQLPSALAELSEESLDTHALPAAILPNCADQRYYWGDIYNPANCSYDGGDE